MSYFKPTFIFSVLSLIFLPCMKICAHGGHGGGHHGGGHHHGGHHGHHHGGHHHHGHHGHRGHHWNHHHHDNPWFHHHNHPDWHHDHHGHHWNNYHHPWHDWYWYGSNYNGWGGNPGYYSDPNYYYYADGTPTVEYEYDESPEVINNRTNAKPYAQGYDDSSEYENVEDDGDYDDAEEKMMEEEKENGNEEEKEDENDEKSSSAS